MANKTFTHFHKQEHLRMMWRRAGNSLEIKYNYIDWKLYEHGYFRQIGDVLEIQTFTSSYEAFGIEGILPTGFKTTPAAEVLYGPPIISKAVIMGNDSKVFIRIHVINA